MSRRLRRWSILGVAVALSLAVWPLARDAAIALALLAQLARPLQSGPLTRWTAPPIREDLPLPRGAAEPLEATLFHPSGEGRGTGLLLIHGVNYTGKDDPGLVWVAELLARAGFVVLTPDFPGLKSLTPRAGDVADIVAAARFLHGRLPGPRADRVGLVAFSYGAGPALVAAADPAVRDQIRLVVSFGGYYDLEHVITFVTTGWYEYGGHRGRLPPEPAHRWTFLRYNLDLLSDPRDRAILDEMARRQRVQAEPDAVPLVAALTPEGRAVYALLTNRDPGRAPALLRRVHPEVRAHVARLSPSRVLDGVRARLFIAHARSDTAIPFTESLRLATAAPDPGRVHLVLLNGFHHVYPAFPPLTWRTLRDFYLREGSALFRWVYRLLRAGA